MKKLFLILCFFPAIVYPAKFSETQVRSVSQGMDDPRLLTLAQKTDNTIQLIIMRGVAALRDQGFDNEASEIEVQYESYRGYVTHMVSGRHIGDHKPLLDFLAKVYDQIEAKLGVQVCKSLHISDIKTLNYCIPVVFHPCTFSLDGLSVDREAEYRRHFAMDDGGSADPEHSLYGLTSVIVYWVVEGICLTSTSGIGSILCGAGATLAEYFMGHTIAPNLSDKLFVRSCGQ